MKKFVLQSLLFAAILLTGVLVVFFMANGNSDPYYLRFTSARQSSMIIGSSRAAQGLQPAVFNSIIYKNTGRHFFNYAFSLLDSPFGPAYYESIEKKLDPETRDGIFVVTVDPWSISDTSANPNFAAGFAENKSFMGTTKQVNVHPNIPYLVQSYDEPYINIIRKWKSKTALHLHKDGWLQLDVPMDSMSVAERTAAKLAFYRKNYLPAYKFSTVRLQYLAKTISLLQKHGTVYLVRLPVTQSMFDIENELMPGFDDKIELLAGKKNVEYLNFRLLKNDYQYVDGHHLFVTSGKQVSALIAAWIVQLPKSK